MGGGEEYQHSSQSILINHIVAYVVGVSFHTQGQDVKDMGEENSVVGGVCRDEQRVTRWPPST